MHRYQYYPNVGKRIAFLIVLVAFCFPLESLGSESSPISVESVCRLNPKGNRWEITNSSDNRIRVTYQVLPDGKQKRVWVNAGQTRFVSQNPNKGSTLQVSYDSETIEVEALVDICHIDGIEFTSVCSDNPNRRRWRVRNPNPFPVFVTYEVYGTDQSKSFYLPKAGKGVVKFEGAPEKEYRFFSTKNVGGANTTKIYYGDNQQITKASGNQICPLPEDAIIVEAVCSDRRNKEQWLITNLSSEKVWVQLEHNNRVLAVDVFDTKNVFAPRSLKELTVSYGGNTTTVAAKGICIDLEEGAIVDSEGIYYIDNKTDFVYHVAPSLGESSVVLTPLLRSPYNDTHMSLNTLGDQLFLVQGGGRNQYGFFDFNTLTYTEIGELNLNAIYQVAFSPNGEMYFAANKSNEVMVMADPLSASFESYGQIKIDGTDNYIALNGADMAFDNDGTFYVATHSGQKIYTVSGKKGHLLAKALAHTNGKRVTGLAVLDAGSGDLIFSAKDQTAMTVVNINDGSFTDLQLFGLDVMDWGDMTGGGLSFRESCDGYASEVVSYDPGTLANGSGTPPVDRMNTSNALGAPQESDNLNFVSLGFGGELVLELASPVYNFNKNGIEVDNPNSINFGETSVADFLIVETSYGRANQNCGEDRNRNYPEKVLVYGAQELNIPGDSDDEAPTEIADWILLSTDESECRTSFIDVAPAIDAGLDFVKYVRLVDVSDPGKFPGSADGYDVDGLIICQDEVIAAITGEGRDGNSLVNARQITSFDAEFFNYAPNEVDPVLTNLAQVYPNPATGEWANLEVSGIWEDAEVSIYSIVGQLISRELVSSQRSQMNISHLKSGNYLVKMLVNGETYSFKLRKQ